MNFCSLTIEYSSKMYLMEMSDFLSVWDAYSYPFILFPVALAYISPDLSHEAIALRSLGQAF